MTDAVTDAPSVGKNVVDAVQPDTLARTLWTQYILNVVGDMLESTITAAPPELIPDTYGSGNGSTITAVPPDTYGSGLGSTIAAVPPDTYGSGLGSTITAVPPDTYGSGDRSTITAVPPDTYESVDGDMLGSTITGTTAIEEIGGIDDKVVQDLVNSVVSQVAVTWHIGKLSCLAGGVYLAHYTQLRHTAHCTTIYIYIYSVPQTSLP
jgi:hypothetical protein